MPVVDFISTPTRLNDDFYTRFCKDRDSHLADVWRGAAVYGTALYESPLEAYDALKPRPIGKSPALGAGYSPPQAPKRKIVFYKFNASRDKTKKFGDVIYMGSANKREAILQEFESALDTKVMFCHVGNCHGWKTRFTADECDIEFLDMNSLLDSEIEQSKGRLSFKY